MNPFRIDGPAHVSTSGGLTSGFMLKRVLEAHGGSLPSDVHSIFCNTGKEREETLRFVHDIEVNWNVPIVWLEYVAPPVDIMVIAEKLLAEFPDHDVTVDASFRVVNFETASRKGEPFDALIEHRSRINEHDGTLPNPVAAWCSSELKQRTMRRWMAAQGYEEWTSVVGLRADEMRRVVKMTGKKLERGWIELPLVRAQVGKDDVAAFWAAQPFTLRLRAYEGNCDACFKKSRKKLETIMVEQPGVERWWAAKEAQTGARWRQDRPGYATLAAHALKQVRLPMAIDAAEDDEDALPCACTD